MLKVGTLELVHQGCVSVYTWPGRHVNIVVSTFTYSSLRHNMGWGRCHHRTWKGFICFMTVPLSHEDVVFLSSAHSPRITLSFS